MSAVWRLAMGSTLTAAFIVGLAIFSAWPSYRPIPEGAAVLKLSFSHGGERTCRQLTEAEQARLPPNMRRHEVCDRRRPPVDVELEIDGALTFAASLPPTGLSGDGPSRVYESFVLPAGSHRIAIRLRDTGRSEGFPYAAERQVILAPGQNLAIDFAPEAGGFIFN